MIWACSENGIGEITKNVMKWSPPRRRKRGRPKATWEEGIRILKILEVISAMRSVSTGLRYEKKVG